MIGQKAINTRRAPLSLSHTHTHTSTHTHTHTHKYTHTHTQVHTHTHTSTHSHTHTQVHTHTHTSTHTHTHTLKLTSYLHHSDVVIVEFILRSDQPCWPRPYLDHSALKIVCHHHLYGNLHAPTGARGRTVPNKMK